MPFGPSPKDFFPALELIARRCLRINQEAFVKALDDDGIAFNEIEVLHTESGKPYINQTRYINSILREHFKSRIEISISHCKEYATAVVVVE